jgi:hypothetical protein
MNLFDEKQKGFLRRCLENPNRFATCKDGEHLCVGDLLFRGYVEPYHGSVTTYCLKLEKVPLVRRECA